VPFYRIKTIKLIVCYKPKNTVLLFTENDGDDIGIRLFRNCVKSPESITLKLLSLVCEAGYPIYLFSFYLLQVKQKYGP